MTKNIGKCYNNLSYYQIQAGIDLMTKAQYLLQQKKLIAFGLMEEEYWHVMLELDIARMIEVKNPFNY